MEFRGHNTYLVLRLGFGPGFCLRSLRLSSRSSLPVKLSPPRGLPVRSCLRRRITSRSAICPLINLPQSSTNSSKGDTLTSRSSRQRVCAAALLRDTFQGDQRARPALDSTRCTWQQSKDTFLPSRKRQIVLATNGPAILREN
jgi:hypothetical protein